LIDGIVILKAPEFAAILSNTLAIKGPFLYPIPYRQTGVMVYKNAEINSWFLPVTVRKGMKIFHVWIYWFNIIEITFSLKGES
jgi:hypothetical protein